MKRTYFFLLVVFLFGDVTYSFADEPVKKPIFSTTAVSAPESHVIPVAEVGLPMYKNIKQFYDYKDYTPGFNDRYDPIGATIASAFVPGLGQQLCGEAFRGVYFTAGIAAAGGLSYLLFTLSNENGTYTENYGYKPNTPLYAAALVCAAGTVAIWVWNAIDANRVAKTKNLYLRDIMDKTGIHDIRLAPSIGMTPGNASSTPTAGLSLALTF